jgi:hypothetical protein
MMGMTSSKRRLSRLASAAALACALTALMTGCFALPPLDSSFEEKIPAALEEAELGLTDVWASRSTSGFTVILNVGGTSETGEVSPEELRSMLQIIVDNNTLGGGRLDLGFRNSDDSAVVDLDGPAQALGADPQVSPSDGPLGINMTWEEVDRLIG